MNKKERSTALYKILNPRMTMFGRRGQLMNIFSLSHLKTRINYSDTVCSCNNKCRNIETFIYLICWNKPYSLLDDTIINWMSAVPYTLICLFSRLMSFSLLYWWHVIFFYFRFCLFGVFVFIICGFPFQFLCIINIVSK